MVTMRDGVKLAADVHRPALRGMPVDQKFPVLLERTPYSKDRSMAVASYFVPRGYVVVMQDVSDQVLKSLSAVRLSVE